MDKYIEIFIGTISSNIETMSVFQMTAAVIWLIMVFSFFLWILYLAVTK